MRGWLARLQIKMLTKWKKIALALVIMLIIAIVLISWRDSIVLRPLQVPESSDEEAETSERPLDRSTPRPLQSSDEEAETSERPLHRSTPISKDMVVRSAHYDDRERNGHKNMYVFMITANRTIIDSKWIVGCGVNDVVSSIFSVNFTEEGFDMKKWFQSDKPFPYDEIFVECYDLPDVKSGSRAFILYKTGKNSSVYLVESEHPLKKPAPRVKPSGDYNFTVVTCTKIHNSGASWIKEFIRYQQTIGVDHVHINILDTFIKDGGMERLVSNPFVKEALEHGYLSYDMWKEWYSSASELGRLNEIKKSEIYLHSEMLRKLDCMYQFRGTYDYVFPLDTDDFFTPRVAGRSNIKHYIQEWFSDDWIGSCKLDWIDYYPESCGMKQGPIVDGNVTSMLKSFKHQRNGKPKSLHKTSALVQSTFHAADCKECLMPGYKVIKVPEHVSYIAHLRNNLKAGC